MKTSSVSNDIIELFKQYEKFYGSRSFGKQARLFGPHLLAAGPRGVAYHKNNAINRFFYTRGMKAFYKNAGLTSNRIISIEQSAISNHFAMVKVHWGATFEKTKDLVIEFDVSYIVWQKKERSEIVMFVAHEDEQQALNKLGII